MTAAGIFLVFYAITWGTMANVLWRWKPFQYPLICTIPQVWNRIKLSLIMWNLIPIAYFIGMLYALSAPGWMYSSGNEPLWLIAMRGVVPAFAVFGFYRIWLGILELAPRRYYRQDTAEPTNPTISDKIEPTVETLWPPNGPLPGSGWANIFFGTIYVVVAVLAAFL
jgi:hypothetical protein